MSSRLRAVIAISRARATYAAAQPALVAPAAAVVPLAPVEAVGAFSQIIGSVSYTHLDVYKRQPLGWSSLREPTLAVLPLMQGGFEHPQRPRWCRSVAGQTADDVFALARAYQAERSCRDLECARLPE